MAAPRRIRLLRTGLLLAALAAGGVWLSSSLNREHSSSNPSSSPNPSSSGEAAVVSCSSTGPRPKKPDIYYIVVEDYGEASTLKKVIGVDTRPFLDFLRSKGFYIASKSVTNYENTHQSLAANLYMEHLDTLVGNKISHNAYVKGLLHDFKVARYLKARGYRYIHIGSWWEPTSSDPTADVDIRYGAVYVPHSRAALTNETRRAVYRANLRQFRNIIKARLQPGPKFVFVHITAPHYPYVFDRDGRFISEEEEKTRSFQLRVGDQVTYVDNTLQKIITRLLSGTERPVIILQTDEGPYPHEFEGHAITFDYRDVSSDDLRFKYKILNAYCFPQVSHKKLYRSITPVNSFRLLFDLYFHAHLPLLPDTVYARELEPYQLIDITKLIRGSPE